MKKRQVAVILVSIVLLLTISGCTAIIHDMAVDSMESATKVLSELTPVAANKSRVVVYMNRLKTEEMLVSGVVFGAYYVEKEIMIESEQGSVKIDVLDQTAKVVDLPAGRYNFMVAKTGAFGKENSLSIDTITGQIHFVKNRKRQTGNTGT